MDKLENIQKSLNEVEQKFEENSLAMEMLRELKKSAQRKFLVIVILIIALVGTNIGWLLYESQFETIEDSTTQTIEQYQENTETSTMSGVIN